MARFTLFWGVIALLCSPLFSSSGQASNDQNVVKVDAYASHEDIHPAESFQIAIVANIKQGFHINSHKPSDEFLIPTVLKLDETRSIAFGPVHYPEPKHALFSFSTNHLSVYDGKISIFCEGKVSEDISLGDTKVSGVLTYQGCDDQRCFMPQSVRFEVPLKIVQAGAPIKLVNKSIFQKTVSLTSDELRAKQV
ncbi:MAG TPA: hypothetical protein EYP19_02345, partial [Desulfobacterales bacterium]|nr:hypothetical protein [Desulfobacterales bacterium]